MDKERRRFKRFTVALDVVFKTPQGTQEYRKGVTRNVSRSGLCFESESSDLSLQEDTELQVRLPGQESYTPVSGKVAWKDAVNDRCWFGIDFSEIDKAAKIEILDHAYDLWLAEKRIQVSAGQK